MGDPTLPTPLAPAEAPFVWLAVTGLPVVLSFLPLVAVFTNHVYRRKWCDYFRRLPWAASGYGLATFLVLNAAFLLLAAGSYWVCRGGHKFQHRIFPAVSYYVTMALFALWSTPVLFSRYRCAPTLVLLVVFGGFVTYTVAAFLSGTWLAGGLACGGAVALLGIAAAWWFDEMA
jgi:hypothetical protein